MSELLRVAIPVSLSFLGLMTMGLVDLIAVGPLGLVATGAVGLGTSVYTWFLVIGTGLLSGMDFFVASNFGAGKKEECGNTLVQGLILSAILSVILTALCFIAAENLNVFGVSSEIAGATYRYLHVLSWSLPPVFFFTAFRNFVQATGFPNAPLYTLLVANGINLVLNYALIFGYWGFPRLGLEGSAWATVFSRVWMAVALYGFALLTAKRQKILIPWRRVDRTRLWQIVKLGGPSAGQITLEVGVFSLSTTLAAKLAPVSLAAHQIVLNTASVTFMVPMGIGAATAVVVGQSVGRKSVKDAISAGRNGLMIGTGFMVFSSFVLWTCAEAILSAYTSDRSVVNLAKELVLVAAFFQVADGVQTVLTGALRGIADTRTSMFANLVGHWCVGLPLGSYLCFWKDMGVEGLWIGLATGLILVAGMLLMRWFWSERRMLRLAVAVSP